MCGVPTGRTRRELLAGAAVTAAGIAVVGAIREDSAEALAQTSEIAACATPPAEGGRYGIRQIIWSVPNDRGLVGLTFDDGPTTRYTPRVLEILRQANATATFNVVGSRALQLPALLRETVDAGHQVGNHTHHHQDLSTLGPRAVRAQMVDAQDALQQCVQAPIHVFRPPRGELTGVAARQAAQLGLDVVMWSLTRDLNVGDVDAVTQSILGRVRAGDIIALHDGLGHAGFKPASSMARVLQRRRDVELMALPNILRGLAERGLTPVSVSQLLSSAPGVVID